MPDSYPFTVWSGLLTPRHLKKIGPALAAFLWCIDRTTREECRGDVTFGLIYGGRPVQLSDIGADLGCSADSVSAHLGRLEAGEYITKQRTDRGLIIEVVHSKKWRRQTNDPEQTGESEKPRFGDSAKPQNPQMAESPVSLNDLALDPPTPPYNPPADALKTDVNALMAWLKAQDLPRAWTATMIDARWAEFRAAGFTLEALKLICQIAVEHGADQGPAYAFRVASDCQKDKAFTAEAIQKRDAQFRQDRGRPRARDAPRETGAGYVSIEDALAAQGVDLRGDDH